MTLHDPIDYSCPVPLFPLPNVVLFPGVVQPLNIFEERYKQMMADTLQDRGLIAMALLCPGWEKDYYGSPAIHPVVCIGKIVAHEIVEEGKYNLLLQGLARARLRGEKRHGLFRIALLEPLIEAPLNAAKDTVHRSILRELFTKGALAQVSLAETVRTLLDRGASTAHLVDMLAFTLLQEVEVKQRLLEEGDPAKRADDLLYRLGTLGREAAPAKAPGEWPPPLHAN